MRDKKQTIKKTATILFAAKGIRNTKIEDITKTLDMAKGGFYYYYKSKEDLLDEIIKESVISRKEFLSTIGNLDTSFENKLKMIVERRLNLKGDRHNLFLFARVYDNGEVSLTNETFIKRDEIFEEFLNSNKEYIKPEYHNEIFKIRSVLSTALTKMLIVLIESTGVKVEDEESYKKMIEEYGKLDIEKEVELFYTLFIKAIVK